MKHITPNTYIMLTPVSYVLCLLLGALAGGLKSLFSFYDDIMFQSSQRAYPSARSPPRVSFAISHFSLISHSPSPCSNPFSSILEPCARGRLLPTPQPSYPFKQCNSVFVYKTHCRYRL